MPRTRVLLVSCYFPPTGGVQVQRALSLARYLPDCGIDLHVLTTSNPRVPTFDHQLSRQIPESVHVHRTFTLEPPFALRKRLWSKLKRPAAPASNARSSAGPLDGVKKSLRDMAGRLLCPDPQVLWYPTAVRAARRLVERHRIEAVVVTAPPFSAFLIGNDLKRRYPHIKLIVDIRDEWIAYFVKTFAFAGNRYVMDKAVTIESDTVALADRVVPVTPCSRDAIRERYPKEPESKFQVIPNGFDPAMFTSFRSRPGDSRKIILTYTGTVYAPASPAAFLDVLDQLPEPLRSRFEVRFIGRIAEEMDSRMFANRKCDVRLIPFVPQSEALQYLEESDYLLLPWSDDLNVPGKLYEYIATRKPILALTRPDSDVVPLIRSTQTGWCVDRSDSEALRAFLMQVASSEHPLRVVPNEAAIQRYERPRLAAEYARLIQDCVASRKDTPSALGLPVEAF